MGRAWHGSQTIGDSTGYYLFTAGTWLTWWHPSALHPFLLLRKNVLKQCADARKKTSGDQRFSQVKELWQWGMHGMFAANILGPHWTMDNKSLIVARLILRMPASFTLVWFKFCILGDLSLQGLLHWGIAKCKAFGAYMVNKAEALLLYKPCLLLATLPRKIWATLDWLPVTLGGVPSGKQQAGKLWATTPQPQTTHQSSGAQPKDSLGLGW